MSGKFKPNNLFCPAFFFFFRGCDLSGGVCRAGYAQDVVGSILADSMLSMSSEPSQPSGHDTADHFTGWSEKGESGKGRVKTKK